MFDLHSIIIFCRNFLKKSLSFSGKKLNNAAGTRNWNDKNPQDESKETSRRIFERLNELDSDVVM